MRYFLSYYMLQTQLTLDEFSYFLGLMYSDGNIHHSKAGAYCVAIKLNIRDREILEYFYNKIEEASLNPDKTCDSTKLIIYRKKAFKEMEK